MRVWMGPIWWIRSGFGRGESDDDCGDCGGMMEDDVECCRR